MPLIWGALSAVLGNLVKTQIGFWAASLLTAFGLHLVVQKFALDPALSNIQSAANGMGPAALAWFAYLNGDKFITMVLSAYAAAAAMSAIRLRRKIV